MKANPFLAGFIADFVDKIEVSSDGEFEICKSYGILAHKIFYTGIYKNEQCVKKAWDYGVRSFNAESLNQLEMLCKFGDEARIFIRLSSQNQFGIDFDTISLVDLVSYESVRSPLSIAVQNMADGKLYDSLVQSRIAFSNLLEDYEGTKMHWYHSILEIGKKQGDKYKNFVKNASLKNANNNMAWFKEISETTNELRDVAKITALGIDFKKYALFKAVTPHIIRFIGEGDSIESEESLSKRVNISEDLCNICINFVIESAVKLQETDYDLSVYLRNTKE